MYLYQLMRKLSRFVSGHTVVLTDKVDDAK